MYRGLWPYYILFLQSLADPKFFWKCSLELKQHSFPSIFHDALFLIIFLRIVVDRNPFAHHTKFFLKSIRLFLYTDIYYYLMMTLVYILFILQFFCFSKIIFLNFSSSKKYRNLLYSSGFQDCELNLLSQRSLSQTRTEIILGLSVSAQRSRQRDRSALKIRKIAISISFSKAKIKPLVLEQYPFISLLFYFQSTIGSSLKLTKTYIRIKESSFLNYNVPRCNLRLRKLLKLISFAQKYNAQKLISIYYFVSSIWYTKLFLQD